MRSAAWMVLIVCGFLVLPGCAIFNKKGADKTPAANPGGTPPAKFPTNNDPLLNGGSASQANPGAVLAGRVVDNFSRPPANTSIRLVSVDGKETGKPTEVTVTPEGYFTIMGLKPGTSYKLVARSKNGERNLGGITYATAPNVRVLIQVKEEFAAPGNADTSAPKTSGLSNTGSFGNNTLPTLGPGGAGNDFEMPVVNVPTPNYAPAPSLPNKQGWTPGPNVADSGGTVWPPPLDIPNPTVKPTPPPLQIPRTQTPPGSLNTGPLPGEKRLDGPARVPSCVLVGKQLINFALNDVNGEPWELKTQRRGRLVLIDFWSTTCIPCRQTIPVLRQLQSQYGNQGLEVLGIAIEGEGSAQEQAYRVNAVAQKMQINYRQLLSSGPLCPVRTQFRIDNVPTLVLVDETGTILWHHVGQPSRVTLNDLESLIQRRLNVR